MPSRPSTPSRIRSAAAIAALALCGACSSSPAELEASSAPLSRLYKENYQEIYRRVAGTAKRCLSNNIGPYSSMAVDTELFPDLGYGEVTVSLINYGTRNYYLSARIERNQTGAMVTAKTGSTLAADRLAQSVMRWADGDQAC